jgi:hypothetical protein
MIDKMIPNNNCYVFACGMERSGSSVYMRMINFLIRAGNLGRKVGDTRLGDFNDVTPKIMAKSATVAGIKLIRAHDYHRLFEVELQQNNAIGFYVWRDIRDVMVSFTLRASSDWSLDDEDWLISNVKRISANYQRWMAWSPDQVMIRTYAELITDPAKLMLETAHALGIRMLPEQATGAAAQFSVDRMRTTMPGDHINDGRLGMWRDHCTEEQADRLQRIVDEYALAELQVATGPQST